MQVLGDIKEETRASKQAVTKIRIVLVDRSVLQVKEYIDAKYKIDKINYAYQYHDEEGKLIFNMIMPATSRAWDS